MDDPQDPNIVKMLAFLGKLALSFENEDGSNAFMRDVIKVLVQVVYLYSNVVSVVCYRREFSA